MHTLTVDIVDKIELENVSWPHLTLIWPGLKEHPLWYRHPPIVNTMSRRLLADRLAALERSTGVLCHGALQAGGGSQEESSPHPHPACGTSSSLRDQL